jgi:hypothetical protein
MMLHNPAKSGLLITRFGARVNESSSAFMRLAYGFTYKLLGYSNIVQLLKKLEQKKISGQLGEVKLAA